MLVDHEGEFVKSLSSGEQVLIDQNAGAKEIRPLELGKGCIVFQVTMVLPHDPGQTPLRGELKILDVRGQRCRRLRTTTDFI